MHVAALFFLASLLWLHANLREQNQLILKLLRLKKDSRCYVFDNPGSIIKRFAKYFKIPLEYKHTIKVKKIRIDRFFRCFIYFVVTKLFYETTSSGDFCLTVIMADFGQIDAIGLQKELSEDLGIRVFVKVHDKN